MIEIQRIANPPKHHLFGFHDICAWNANNDRLVALEVETINAPPDPNLEYGLGYVDNENNFVLFGTTHAFNYPQGAREQWIGKTNNVIVNDIKDERVISKVYDTDKKELIDVLDFPTHVVTNDGWALGINYARLFRLGAYGYAGAKDETIGIGAPENDGIIKHNIHTKEYKLLLSIKDVSEFQNNSKNGKHHYITHLVLSPNQERIAFLHRFKLNDGGEMTRLCTIGLDGQDLRCLGSGFLSHFDWADDNHIMIWGRTGSNVEKLRNSLLYQLIPTSILSIGKSLMKKAISNTNANSVSQTLFHWIKFEDKQNGELTFIAEGIITEDGHPMFCPIDRNWFICDNYPKFPSEMDRSLNKNGIRTLFLFNIKENKKVVLGDFKMIPIEPDLMETERLLKGIDIKLINKLGVKFLASAKTGLHCDLHPRWSPNGEKISFDSIHEGTRQIYVLNVKEIIKPK
jgi:hypothetical protein